jgi:hypothetical protein
MSGDLQNIVAVAPFEEELASWRASNGQTAQYEGSGRESECLLTLLPLGSDEVKSLGAAAFCLVRINSG